MVIILIAIFQIRYLHVFGFRLHRQEMTEIQLTAKDTVLCGQRRCLEGEWLLNWTW